MRAVHFIVFAQSTLKEPIDLSLSLSLSLSLFLSLFLSPLLDRERRVDPFSIQNPARERARERGRAMVRFIFLLLLLHDVGNENEGQGSRVGTNNKHHTYANGNK